MRQRKQTGLLPGFLLLSCGMAFAAPPASDGAGRVTDYLAALDTLQASFSQEVVNRDLDLVEAASGQVTLSKPGRFRWDYTEPFERVIVADGERVWLYEADLDQVTVRRLDAGLGETPAALLTGSVSILDRFDYLGSESGEDGLTWVTLGPKDDAADFEFIRLGFDGAELRQLALADRLGQTTRIRFSAIRKGLEVDDATFTFEPPPGADVIGEGEL